MKTLLEWSVMQDDDITREAVHAIYGKLGQPDDRREDLDSKFTQIYSLH